MKGLAALAEAWHNCSACPLCQTRQRMVFGAGPQDARIMVVGTAPGGTEDRNGVPFCGRAGKRMAMFMKEAGLDIQSLFLTNVVCCRPFITNDKGRAEDRDPSTPEVKACWPRLAETIYIIDPLLIIAAGGVALSALTGVKTGVNKARGNVYTARIPGRTREIEKSVLATIHPAALLRNPDIGPTGWVRKTIDDYKKAAAIAKREALIYDRLQSRPESGAQESGGGIRQE